MGEVQCILSMLKDTEGSQIFSMGEAQASTSIDMKANFSEDILTVTQVLSDHLNKDGSQWRPACKWEDKQTSRWTSMQVGVCVHIPAYTCRHVLSSFELCGVCKLMPHLFDRWLSNNSILPVVKLTFECIPLLGNRRYTYLVKNLPIFNNPPPTPLPATH